MKKKLILLPCFVIILLTTNKIWGQNIYTIAGNGSYGFSGDGGPAITAQLDDPIGIAVDTSGNIYIADFDNQRIRKVNPAGVISTFAGTGVAGSSGDGGAATSARLNGPNAVAVDASGNVYISEYFNSRIRKVNPAGVISTFAGNGPYGFSGDGGPAITAQLFQPNGVAVDTSGNVYISDKNNNRIRKVNKSGIISTFAGTGVVGFSGDGGAATSAQLYAGGVCTDSSGNVYIADSGNSRVRKVNTSGIISTFAGTGVVGFSGDGSAATSAQLGGPNALAVDGIGNVYIADGYYRIRKVNQAGVISTLAGTGIAGYNGDGNAAINAQLNLPQGVAVNALGNVYISDRLNQRIRIICFGGCLANIFSFAKNEDKILISPNPNNGLFKLQIDSEIKEGEIILMNSLGQKIHEQKIVQGENEINTYGLAKGLYHYLMLQNKEQISNGKIAIE